VILSLILSTLATGIVGLFSFVVAGYMLAMLYQVAVGLWKRHKERQQSPFELVADNRYRPLATIRPQAPVDAKAEYFRPLYVKAGNK
jgi:hypothetical protein